MPRVVIDTNVLIRALLKPDSSDGLVMRGAVEGKLDLFFSLKQISELKRALTYKRIRKRAVTDEDIKVFLKTLLSFGNIISITEKITLCRDADDNEILSIAASVYKDNPVYLVTADKDLLVLKEKIEKIKIVTPQHFLKRIRLSV